jgi:UDP-N-acetylglucosamine 4-epimerase
MNRKQKITKSVVLVSGGAGFIGSNLCEVLLNQDNKVICLDNFSTGYRENINEFLSHSNFTLIEGDIRDYETCAMAVKNVDFVLHQAALGSVPRSIKDPMTTTEVNVSGFVNMLHASQEAKVKRFVYASSSSVYGDSSDLPKLEAKIGKPLSPYAVSKLSNEIYAKNFSELYGIETIGLRYFNVYGQRQNPNGPYAALIPNFILKLYKHEQPVINGDGSYSRDFTYVDNVMQANQLAALTPRDQIVGEKQYLAEVFNIACGGSTTVNEILQRLYKECIKYDSDIESIKPIYGKVRKGDVPHSQADVMKAEKLLGFDPKYDIDIGIEKACRWYWGRLMNK